MPGLQNNYKVQNTCIIGIPEEEERLKGKEELSETIITENSPQIDGRHQSQSREAWETLLEYVQTKQNKQKISTPQAYIIFELQEIKNKKFLQEARERKNIYRRTC